MGERLGQARDLHPGEALGRVEAPLGDGGVDDAADGMAAGFQGGRDLLVGKAGNEQVEHFLLPLEAFRPALARERPRPGALRGGCKGASIAGQWSF